MYFRPVDYRVLGLDVSWCIRFHCEGLLSAGLGPVDVLCLEGSGFVFALQMAAARCFRIASCFLTGFGPVGALCIVGLRFVRVFRMSASCCCDRSVATCGPLLGKGRAVVRDARAFHFELRVVLLFKML